MHSYLTSLFSGKSKNIIAMFIFAICFVFVFCRRRHPLRDRYLCIKGECFYVWWVKLLSSGVYITESGFWMVVLDNVILHQTLSQCHTCTLFLSIKVEKHSGKLHHILLGNFMLIIQTNVLKSTCMCTQIIED